MPPTEFYQSLSCVAVFAFLSGCGGSGPSENSQMVSPAVSVPADTGMASPDMLEIYPWPSTVTEVTLRCASLGKVYVETAAGETYAVNGTAQSSFQDVDPIWLSDPEGIAPKVSIGGVLRAGPELCDDPIAGAQGVKIVPGPNPQTIESEAAPIEAGGPAELSLIDEADLFMRFEDETQSNATLTGRLVSNMPFPIEVMLGVSLVGLEDDDPFIGARERLKVTSSDQRFQIALVQDGKPLPAGSYSLEADFYPGWGADVGTAAAKSIKREIQARQPVSLTGERSAELALRGKNGQVWLMENVGQGDPFDLALYKRHLGEPVQFKPRNGNSMIHGYYFPDADVTIFMSESRRETLIWKLGRHDEM